MKLTILLVVLGLLLLAACEENESEETKCGTCEILSPSTCPPGTTNKNIEDSCGCVVRRECDPIPPPSGNEINCITEGEFYSYNPELVGADGNIQEGIPCCEGLQINSEGSMHGMMIFEGECVDIPFPVPEIQLWDPTIRYTCSDCGNGVCSDSENVCTCPDDCQEDGMNSEQFCERYSYECKESNYTIPPCDQCDNEENLSVLLCAGQGEHFDAFDSELPDSCCDGLTISYTYPEKVSINESCFSYFDSEMADMYPSGTCFTCGDGVCGEHENICNCKQDCYGKGLSEYKTKKEFCVSNDFKERCVEGSNTGICGMCYGLEECYGMTRERAIALSKSVCALATIEGINLSINETTLHCDEEQQTWTLETYPEIKGCKPICTINSSSLRWDSVKLSWDCPLCTEKDKRKTSISYRSYRMSQRAISQCCQGLENSESRNKVSVDGVCYDLDGFPYFGGILISDTPLYYCIDCGDTICGDYETICNCPQDCSQKSQFTQSEWCQDRKHITICDDIDEALRFVDYPDDLERLCQLC